jgi:hypothetical protein
MLRAGRGDRFISVETIYNGIVTRADRILLVEEHMTFWIDDAAKTLFFPMANGCELVASAPTRRYRR